MTPDRGDIVWIDLDPLVGPAPCGRNPVFILTPRAYHQVTPFALVCPIVSTRKGYPFEVELPAGLHVAGVVLADQVKSIDRRNRRIERASKASAEFVEIILAKVLPLLIDKR
jgi:mRNA interferase MazF